jgi:aminopeptidase N
MKLSIKIVIIVIIVLVASYFVFNTYRNFGEIPSGGKLSSNQAAYDVSHYYIEAEILPETKSIRAFTDIKFTVVKSFNTFEFDLLNQLNIEKIVFEQNELTYTRDLHKVFAELPNNLTEGDVKMIRIYYDGEPLEAKRPPWSGGFNWSKTQYGDWWIGLSCQGEGAKVWMPVKDHPSDEADSVDVRLIVDNGYTAVSNGKLIAVENVADKKRFHWKTNYTTNNYNIAVNVAKYEELTKVVNIDSMTYPIVYHTIHNDENAEELVRQAEDMLTRLSKYLGPYPFHKERFGLVETDYLGMEHQTVNSYGNRYRYTPVTNDEGEELRFDMLMLHEMAHEWFGNKITVKDWADFWIHEGIGSYVEAIYIRDLAGEAAYHRQVATYKKRTQNDKPIIPFDNATTSDSYSNDIYPKGAYLMHTLRFILGDENFWPMVMEFCMNPKYTYENFTSTEDFIALVHNYTDYDLQPLFDMHLRTTELIQFELRKKDGKYEYRIANPGFRLPVEIQSEMNLVHILDNNWQSNDEPTKPVIDPKEWYLMPQVNDMTGE